MREWRGAELNDWRVRRDCGCSMAGVRRAAGSGVSARDGRDGSGSTEHLARF